MQGALHLLLLAFKEVLPQAPPAVGLIPRPAWHTAHGAGPVRLRGAEVMHCYAGQLVRNDVYYDGEGMITDIETLRER